jgi:hypothetical protein
VVASRDVSWQLGNSLVEHGDVIGHRVGPSVPRTQQYGQRFPCGIRKAEQWMEAVMPISA